MGDGVGDVVAVSKVDGRTPVAREALVEAPVGEVAGHGKVRAVLAVATLLDESGGHDPALGRDRHVERARPVHEPERRAHDAAFAEAGVEAAVRPVASEHEAPGEPAVSLSGDDDPVIALQGDRMWELEAAQTGVDPPALPE
jgi:hypothetical protein